MTGVPQEEPRRVASAPGGLDSVGAREVPGGRPSPSRIVPGRVDFADYHLSIFEITKDPIGVPEQTVGFLQENAFSLAHEQRAAQFLPLDLLAGLREVQFHLAPPCISTFAGCLKNRKLVEVNKNCAAK